MASNALNYSAVLWDEVFAEIASAYPDVESDSVLVDAAAVYPITEPERFQMVVASNLFADILTEIGAALQGGLGSPPAPISIRPGSFHRCSSRYMAPHLIPPVAGSPTP